jgi:hypothetical protein
MSVSLTYAAVGAIRSLPELYAPAGGRPPSLATEGEDLATLDQRPQATSQNALAPNLLPATATATATAAQASAPAASPAAAVAPGLAAAGLAAASPPAASPPVAGSAVGSAASEVMTLLSLATVQPTAAAASRRDAQVGVNFDTLA